VDTDAQEGRFAPALFRVTIVVERLARLNFDLDVDTGGQLDALQ
jgi:hypothetical protein